MAIKVLGSADVDASAEVGEGTTIWHLAQVRERVRIGSNCVVGRGAYIGPAVTLGNAVKVQNYALIYEPATVGDGAFIGPAVVFTNDRYPRAVDPSGRSKGAADWKAEGVIVGEGASIGAHAVCVGPVSIGRWAMVAAGAVVIRDVDDFGLVAGVPARRVGWVGRAGHPLRRGEGGEWTCPATQAQYVERKGHLVEGAP